MAKKIKHNWTYEPSQGDAVIVFWADHGGYAGFQDATTEIELLDFVFKTVGYFWKYAFMDCETLPNTYRTLEVMFLAATRHHKNLIERGDFNTIITGAIFDVQKI